MFGFRLENHAKAGLVHLGDCDGDSGRRRARDLLQPRAFYLRFVWLGASSLWQNVNGAAPGAIVGVGAVAALSLVPYLGTFLHADDLELSGAISVFLRHDVEPAIRGDWFAEFDRGSDMERPASRGHNYRRSDAVSRRKESRSRERERSYYSAESPYCLGF